jgi:amino acid transporter
MDPEQQALAKRLAFSASTNYLWSPLWFPGARKYLCGCVGSMALLLANLDRSLISAADVLASVAFSLGLVCYFTTRRDNKELFTEKGKPSSRFIQFVAFVYIFSLLLSIYSFIASSSQLSNLFWQSCRRYAFFWFSIKLFTFGGWASTRLCDRDFYLCKNLVSPDRSKLIEREMDEVLVSLISSVPSLL